MTDQLKRRFFTATAAAIGTGVFWLLALPLPFLLGPIFFCLALALAGAKLEGMGLIGTIFRTFLGLAAGTSVTPDVVGALPQYLPSLAFVPVFVVLIALCSYPLMRRMFGFDPVTSYYCAMPGGLQDLVIFGEQAGANLRVLALIQATRILFVVALAPFAISAIWGIDLTTPPGQPATDIPPVQLLIMIATGIIGWQIAERIGLFGASILGPMILSAILSASGIITYGPPTELIWAAQFFIGIAVGSKYVGITAHELRTIVWAGVVNGVLLSVVSVCFILVVLSFDFAQPLEVVLSFLPGGQGEMLAIALVAQVDLMFVALHHLVRVALIVALAPVVMKRLF